MFKKVFLVLSLKRLHLEQPVSSTSFHLPRAVQGQNESAMTVASLPCTYSRVESSPALSAMQFFIAYQGIIRPKYA
jgi:hypothetical protein